MGEDLAFQLTYRLDAALRFKLVEGLQSYGPTHVVMLEHLDPNTKYHAQIRFYCGRNSNLATDWSIIKFSTLRANETASTACGTPVVAPRNFSAKETGAYHISLHWFKPMPDSYKYKISYARDGANDRPKTDLGSTAFGPMFSYQTYDLLEKTNYKFNLRHVCKGEPTKESDRVTASAKTLDAGKILV